MPYRIITYRIENDRLLEDYSQEHHLHIEETEKAVLVFEADMIVCRLFIDFTDARFGDKADGIRKDLREGNSLGGDTRDILDEIFEDILTFVEYYENRMTSLSDSSIANVMVHTRFSAAYLLRIDYSRSEKHKHTRSNKKMNSSLFRHDSKDEVGEVYHLEYNKDLKKRIAGTVLDYKGIIDILDSKGKDGIVAYFDRILSEMNGDTRMFNIRLPQEEIGVWKSVISDDVLFFRNNPYFPLFRMVDAIAGSLPDMYKQYVHLDYKDMSHNNIRVMAPALGSIFNREYNLNSAQKSPQEVIESYDKGLMEREILFTRILDSIFRSSSVDHSDLEFRFTIRDTMRLLDPRLFGWKYDIPPVVFCMDSKKTYERFMRCCKKFTVDGAVAADWVKIVQSDWAGGKRERAGNRVPGGIFKFSSIEYVLYESISEYMQDVKEPTIIVTSADRMDEMISFLSSFSTAADRNKVKSVYVVSPVENFIFPEIMIPYTSVALVKEDRLLDVLSLHNVRLIELAVENYMDEMASEMGVTVGELSDLQPTDIRASIYKKFAEEVKVARKDLEDTRRILDNLD